MKAQDFHNIGYRLLGDLPSRYFPLSGYVRKSLSVAHLRISHIIYISSMIFWALLSMILAAIVSFPFIYMLSSLNILSLSMQWFLYPIGATIGTGAIVMMMFLYYPHQLAGSMRTGLDKNIVYIINYMSILAGAGVTTENIFGSLAEKGEIYKVQGSAKAIVRDVEVLGKDIITAIDDESANTSSKKFSKLLVGLNGIARTGGNLQHYLSDAASRQILVRRRELSKVVGQLNLAAETYIILGIAFPVILTTLLSMMGVFGGNVMAGLNPVQIMSLMTYIFFPLCALAVLLLTDGMTSSMG
ncbi:type II secretion system F family protein [Candidatus Bathyarchaeota archaeon]|nr:type II secretion system F family protein [Candidatus Bathyarchaeota archaeon]